MESAVPASLDISRNRAIQVSNPMDLTRVPPGQVYQINHPHFILQFFFSGQNLMGFVLKRDPAYPIFVRWCFFRSCEESPFDYKAVLANRQQSPFTEEFFQLRLPVRHNYKFQGLEFTTGYPLKPTE